MTDKHYQISDLIYLMARLRDPDTGCPWDIKQSYSGIVPHTLEEAYEVAAAIEQGDFDNLREELGDLLFQVIFYTQMASEEGRFDFNDVLVALINKLVTRHPHVFPEGRLHGKQRSPADLPSEQMIKDNWESRKERDRRAKGHKKRLSNIPLALPALSRAQKLQRRAANHGFDWENISQVVDKIDEEAEELKAAILAGENNAIEDELGDLIFVCVNLARHAGLDAEAALRRANGKFESRFETMEALCEARGQLFDSLGMDEKNALWDEAKRIEKQ
ncbi:MAG TPA: nucleoside triphosphate pyrophosphohydrolase [Porticoccaceae bacterium]|nr:nucleoside triphosphate pyrophosphohydrolase [Porticoccaceae bacterium]HCO60336.1 nucleoside triphosphate pyrophosphohydrolase [Porticoccaceae bacterium]